MKQLNRGVSPSCLAKYAHGTHIWENLTADDKAEIWQNLTAMQGQFCAYCEAPIEIGKQHIEHFVQRSRRPELTFDWTNLFGSCNIRDTCGDRKDKVGTYVHSQVLRPDQDQPDDFLVFVVDGTIAARQGLSAADNQKASETLKILGLHHQNGQLRHMRRKNVEGYIQIAEEYAEFAECDPDNTLGWRNHLNHELTLIADLPFSTAIRHMFESVLDC